MTVSGTKIESAIALSVRRLMEAEQGQFSMALSQLTQALETSSEKLGTLSAIEQYLFIQQIQADLDKLSSERSLQVRQAYWAKIEREGRNLGQWYLKSIEVKRRLALFPFFKRWHCNACGIMRISRELPNYCDQCIESERQLEVSWEIPF